jgi:hypothetical protein
VNLFFMAAPFKAEQGGHHNQKKCICCISGCSYKAWAILVCAKKQNLQPALPLCRL